MGLAVDTGLEFFRQVLALRGVRQQILSADIANASTPGFKAVDLDFRQALASATKAGDPAAAASPRIWLVDDARQLSIPGGASVDPALNAAVKYQTDSPVTLDGNSVDLGREKVAAAENAVHYEATASFATQVIRMLTTAVGGNAGPASGG